MTNSTMKALKLENCAGQLAQIFLQKRFTTSEELDYIHQLILRCSETLDEICDDFEKILVEQAEEVL